jgi:methylthioribulose-1-phosphate dehydratase
VSAAVTPAALQAAGAQLARESARCEARGWMPGTAGNLSVVLSRDPLRVAVTASGKDKGELSSADVVVVDAVGDAVPDQPRPDVVPSAEAGLHARIAALTGAGAAVHVHALNAVLAGHHFPDGVVLRDLEMLKGLGFSAHDQDVAIPVVPNSQDMAELADALQERWAALPAGVLAAPAVIVARHGIYTWGDDLVQARHRTELAEALLAIAVATRP